MADTWEWGPWAQQGQDYVKSEREKEAKIAEQNNSSSNALKNMLAGKQADQDYKIADENRQAENAVPALRTMLSGPNSAEGGALGFTPQSTDQDYRGLAKAAPGIATTILNKRLENATTTNKPVSVAKGAALVSPTGTELYKNTEGDKEGGVSFPSPEAAQAYWESWKQRDPRGTQPYRPNIQADPVRGGYKLNLQSAETLQESPAVWLSNSMDMARPVQERIEAKMKYDQWQKDQAVLAGTKAFAANQATPASVDWQNQFSKAQQASNAFEQLQSFTEPERRAFVLGPGVAGVKGLTNKEAWFNTMSGLPGGMSVVNALGGKQATIDRFNTFHTLLGSIRELAFVTGGKQLTKTEEDVVLAKIPTGQEKSYSEFQAKFQYATKLLKAINDGMILANQVPKGDPNYNLLMGAVWRQAFAQNNIDLRDPERNVRSQMSSGDRLLDKANSK